MSYIEVSTSLVSSSVPFGVELRAVNPRLNSSRPLENFNGKPEVMFRIARNEMLEGAGWIEPTDPRSVWRMVYPRGQYVSPAEQGNPSSHYMLTPELPYFATPENLTLPQLTEYTEHVMTSLTDNDDYATYNIGADQIAWHSDAQSWKNFHGHCIRVPSHMFRPLETPNTNKVEPGGVYRTPFFRDTLSAVQGNADVLGSLSMATFLDEGQGKKAFGHSPHGLVLTLPTETTPVQLAEVMKDMDRLYRIFHKNTYSYMVSNYDEVAKSGWQEDYQVRTAIEMKQLMDSDGLNYTARNFLNMARFAVRRSRSTTDPNLRVYKSPCYSVGIRKCQNSQLGGYAIIFDPHSLKKNGGLEAMGVDATRDTVEGADTQIRLTSAVERFRYINSLTSKSQALAA